MLDGLPLSSASVYTVVVPAPGLGAQWNYTVPAGYQVLIVGLRSDFDTNATAVNRYPGLSFRIGGRTFLLRFPTAILLNTLWTLFWIAGRTDIQTVTPNIQEMTFPFPVVLNPGDLLSSDFVNLQAGDNIDTIYLSLLRGTLA
jgi:hypothetical protein